MSYTLKKLLKQYDNSMKLNLGSVDGGGYWYVGTIGDLRRKMVDYDTACMLNADTMRQRAHRRLNGALNRYPTTGSYAREQLRSSKRDLSLEKYNEYVEHWFARIERLKQVADLREEEYADYEALENREVKDFGMVDKAINKDTLRVVIVGHERGSFWFRDEADTIPCIAFSSAVGEEGDDDAGEEE